MYVHAETVDLLKVLFNVAVPIQATDAHARVDQVAELVEGEPDESAHPSSGPRPSRDEMLDVIGNWFVPHGQGASPSTEEHFNSLLSNELLSRYWVLANGGPTGMTAEFSFHSDLTAIAALALGGNAGTALFHISTEERHPQLGSGLLCRLHLPVPPDPVLGHELNVAETSNFTGCQFLGAWVNKAQGLDSGPVFVQFIPAVTYSPVLLPLLVQSMAVRARWARDYIAALGNDSPEPPGSERTSTDTTRNTFTIDGRVARIVCHNHQGSMLQTVTLDSYPTIAAAVRRVRTRLCEPCFAELGQPIYPTAAPPAIRWPCSKCKHYEGMDVDDADVFAESRLCRACFLEREADPPEAKAPVTQPPPTPEPMRAQAAVTPLTREEVVTETTLPDFIRDDSRAEALIRRTVSRPAGLAFAYALLMGFTGQGWEWLAAPLAIAVGGGCELGTLFARIRGQRSGGIWSLWLWLTGLVFLAGVATVFFHATFVSGIGALWQNAVVRLSIPGILLALLVLTMAWHYCKAINGVFELMAAAKRVRR